MHNGLPWLVGLPGGVVVCFLFTYEGGQESDH